MEANRSSFLIFVLIALYVLSPIDLMPACPIDDIAMIALGLSSRTSHNA